MVAQAVRGKGRRAMNGHLEEEVLHSIVNRWYLGNRGINDPGVYTDRNAYIDTKDVYQDLLGRGVEVPEGVMQTALESLEVQGIIRGVPYQDIGGTNQHGARIISWIDPNVLGASI